MKQNMSKDSDTNYGLLYYQNKCKLSFVVIFTALHAMQTRSSDENSVCPSVRPSVCHMRGL